jgi:hypothetical protein
MKNQVSNARTSSISLFSGISKENYGKMISLETHIKELEKKPTKIKGEDEALLFEQKITPFRNDLAKSSLIVIVFSTMAVEAYMYDYAARYLGDAFVKDHLDKLDTLSKWIIVPKLITGRELPRQQKWFELLKKLIKARNSVIHHKSSDAPIFSMDIQQYMKKRDANSELLDEAARQSTTLLNILADKIAEIDPEETPWVNLYLT